MNKIFTVTLRFGERMRKRLELDLVSAGGVVYRLDGGGGVEVAICGRAYPEIWGLPKGTPDDGETELQTALREVREETGLEVVEEGYVGNVKYAFVRARDGARCRKTVHFYLMRPVGGDVSLHDHEFDFVRWMSAEDACRNLTHDNEVAIVQQSLSMVGERADRAGADARTG